MAAENYNPTGAEEMEVRIWEYIDGLTTSTEKAGIEKLLEENAVWKEKYHELLHLHQSLNLVELEQPSLRFTRNVMEEISRHSIAPAARKYINNKVILGIGIFFITTIIGFLIYGIGQIDWSVASDNKSFTGVDLTKVDFTSIFSNNFVNIFMMLNVVLGLMLIDRFLEKKKKAFMNEA
jgi:hypothetical protein